MRLSWRSYFLALLPMWDRFVQCETAVWDFFLSCTVYHYAAFKRKQTLSGVGKCKRIDWDYSLVTVLLDWLQFIIFLLKKNPDVCSNFTCTIWSMQRDNRKYSIERHYRKLSNILFNVKYRDKNNHSLYTRVG